MEFLIVVGSLTTIKRNFVNRVFVIKSIFSNLVVENYYEMNFNQIKFGIWLLEQLCNAPAPGLTLKELQERWTLLPGHYGSLSRDMLGNNRARIENTFGIVISAPDRKHYRIMNSDSLIGDNLVNTLLKSIQNYMFLQEFKDLRDRIQPECIENGVLYLSIIGQALRDRKKMRMTYKSFDDSASNTFIIYPYCLKADKGRWYILAHKENNTHNKQVQVFALDRTIKLELTGETFKVDKSINPSTFFNDCFGIWHEFDKYPVQDIAVAVKPYVANYLRTLPLHHSQREETFVGKDERVHFSYHISPSPDFIAEVLKWGDDAEILK